MRDFDNRIRKLRAALGSTPLLNLCFNDGTIRKVKAREAVCMVLQSDELDIIRVEDENKQSRLAEILQAIVYLNTEENDLT